MTELLRGWITALSGSAVVCCAAMCLCPKGRVREVLRLVCGAVMALALISPLAKLDFDSYALGLAEYRQAAQEISAKADEARDSLTRTVIEEEYAAYISDKARQEGVSVTSVSVSVKWGDDGCWYPYEAHIAAEGDTGKDSLSSLIEAELGIPAERQYWS